MSIIIIIIISIIIIMFIMIICDITCGIVRMVVLTLARSLEMGDA